ncbi:methionyl-tRNA formyltransferase [Candidatus Kaiserbacteria bacterium CG10_big_fil_rev_8_21_14_0_10_45_20]|uniref:methionyl-tRNA formyltransferase n=1 Tax=Candidatus Kaiserbacteria bacterium CG10_big_fil_rev_8_21_14_0_10_45_20 TaxID=1974607 RepID=A0A2H0UG62_9BACT|nr:MAG: methionyl-tRNA formyltransferase [Candidatus Kaiserbacteria bacterium CG10_big_fil_rev_8_21_14_0_10_45_20]
MNHKQSNNPIAFFGTSLFAVFVLEELVQAGTTPDIVVTVPDRPAGRGLELTPPPVKTWAIENNIPVIQPASLKEESDDLSLLLNTEWDVFIVASYGKIIPKTLLDTPRRGTLNVHPSLLPKFRGPSPIESQILADERDTGVTIMLLDEEVDHGPIVAQASITPETWPLSRLLLEELLAREGGKLLAEALPPWIAKEFEASEQNHTEATFTKKIEKGDGHINLDDDGYQNYLKYLAYEGWPGVFFFVQKNGKDARVKITEAECADGTFRLLSVTPEGKKETPYADFLKQD